MSSILNKHASVKKGSGSADRGDQPEHKEVDLILDRTLEYKSIVKGFISYYEDVAKLEAHSASELQRIGGHVPVPLKEGHQFLPHGDGRGWQDILYNVRDQTRAIAEQHTNLSRNITDGIVRSLERTKTELKHFVTELETEPQSLAKNVGSSRSESTKLISSLNQGLATAKGNPLALNPKDDPVVVHRNVEAQLKQQINDENALTSSIITYQQRSGVLEAKVIRDIQQATNQFSQSYTTAHAAITRDWEAIHTRIAGLDPELEYTEFTKRTPTIPADTPMRDPAQISFPGQNDEHTKPLKVGLLERKNRFTKNYKEAYYVLTPSGWLHAHKTSDPVKHGEPEKSLFLPSCVLGPPAQESSGKYKWHVEEGKSSTGGGSKLRKTLKVGNKDTAYSFKARSYGEMMGWWNAMESPAKASLTAATTSSSLQDGSAVAAVRGVGFTPAESETAVTESQPQSIAQEEDEDEEGGSSEEEEDTFQESTDNSMAPALGTAPALGATTTTAKQTETLPEYEKGAQAAVAGDVKEKPMLTSDTPHASTSTG